MSGGGAGGLRPSSRSYLPWTSRTFSVIALISFVVLYFSVPPGIDTWVIVVNLIAFYLVGFRALAQRDTIIESIPTQLTPNVLYLFASYLFFYYPYQLYLLGASDLSGGDLYYGLTFLDGSNAAITLSTVGTLAFTLGFDVLRDAGRASPAAAPPPQDPVGAIVDVGSNRYFKRLAWVSTSLLFVLVSAYLGLGWRAAGEGRYTNSTAAATLGVEGVYLAASMICMTICALWVYGKANGIASPPILNAGLVLTALWILRLLLLGDRNTALLVVLTLVGGYYTFVRRISGRYLILFALVGIVVYNFLEVAREIPEWYLPSRIAMVLQDPEAFRSLGGNSSFDLGTVSVRGTVQAVPNTYGYGYGVAKLIAVLSIIPFAAQILVPYLRPEFLGSSSMIQAIMVGEHGRFSPGTNVISDSYIEFGVAGVILIPFLLGLAAKVFRNYVARDPLSLQRVVLYLIAMPLYGQLPRYSVELLLRPLVWSFVLLLVVRVLSSNSGVQTKGERKEGTRGEADFEMRRRLASRLHAAD